MEIIGKLSHILEAKSGVSQRTGNPWMSQDFVIEFVSGQYVRHFSFTIFGEEKINNFANLLVVGKDIKVHFDVDAKEYNGRWFNSINAWKIEDAVSSDANAGVAANTAAPAPANPANPAPAQAAPAPPAPQVSANGGDELPF